MRGTLHLVAAGDIRPLAALLGNTVVRARRRRYEGLGIDDRTADRAAKVAREALAAGSPLKRGELFEALSGAGISTAGQRGIHLLSRAALEGIICFGPEIDGDETFVLVDEWLPGGAPSPAGTAAGLARRYAESYGPVTLADFKAWSGLDSATCGAAWDEASSELAEIDVDGGKAWLPSHLLRGARGRPPSGPVVRLLPGFEPYLLAYKDRSLAVSPAGEKLVNAGGGLVRPILCVDGKVAGTWKSRKKGGVLEIEVKPFNPVDKAVVGLISKEADDIGRFLGMEAVLTLK